MASTVRAPRHAETSVARSDAPGRSAPQRPVLRLASMYRRLAGAAIDMGVVVVISGLLWARFASTSAGVTRVRIDSQTGERIIDEAATLPIWLPVLVVIVVSAAYTIPLMAIWGRTLGGLLVGIRCVRADSGLRPGWLLSMRRWLALYGAAGLLSFVPLIGALAWLVTLVVGLSPLWDATHRLRGYADHLGGDLVVDASRSG